MERREVRFHPAARAEYHDATRWYRAYRPESGVEFQREIEHAIELILQYPEAWPHADETCRRFIVNRFRHALVLVELENSRGKRGAMSGQRRMYLGGPDGAVILGECDGRWEPERTLLDGMDLRSLLVTDQAGTMYAQVADSIYVSGDGGDSWDRAFEPRGKISMVACDPTNARVVYVGMEPVALHRSRDAGGAWEEIESLRRQPESVRETWWSPAYPHESHVRDLYVDPRDPERIYVSLEHGGVMRSDDGGATWENLIDGFETLDIHVVRAHPAHPHIVYAATARGVYRSDDFGRGWVRTRDGLAYDHTGAFALSGGARTALFLSAARGTPPSWVRPTGAEASVFRSDDDGLTWHRLGGGLPALARGPYRSLIADPLDPDRIYAGAVDPTPTVWGSADRGDTWTVLHEGTRSARLLCVAA